MAAMAPQRAPSDFRVQAPFVPAGDQPGAIAACSRALLAGQTDVLLKGATGTGKTFCMAHVISELNRPSLVLCANKTLAAQVARELRHYLPENRVEYFVSYYAHYRPESYVPSSDVYYQKKANVDKTLDALRHKATASLLERSDVVVVSSVSCLYGLGMPSSYMSARISIRVGDDVGSAEALAESLHAIQYNCRSEMSERLNQGEYQLRRGVDDAHTTVRFWPPQEDAPVDLAIDDDGILRSVRPLDSTPAKDASASPPLPEPELDAMTIYPARHFVTPPEQLETACTAIEEEMRSRVKHLRHQNREVAADRLEKRVVEDVARLRVDGFCQGMENYSRHLAGREAGTPPTTLVDFMSFAGITGRAEDESEPRKRPWLLICDESHVSVPQLATMYAADRTRKMTLVEHGFRLPSALDNRPLKGHEEFWPLVPQTLYVSATPGDYEERKCMESASRLRRSGSTEAVGPVDMVIRPTGVLDPNVEVIPKRGNYINDHLIAEIRERAEKGQRSLVTTLTQADSESLAQLLDLRGIRATFLHCKLTAVARAEVLSNLQAGHLDAVVGVNLLREGLDLPEVALVAVLDADKQGFLRSYRSLIQTVGRAARHVEGHAVLYANSITPAIRAVLDETERRRRRQIAHNERTGIVPRSTRNVGSSDSLFELRKEEIERVEEAKRLMFEQAKADAEKGRMNAGGMNAVAENNAVAVAVNGSAEAGVAIPPPQLGTEDRMRVAALHEAVRRLPRESGVYLWRAAPTSSYPEGEVLYVGKANNLRQRCASYLPAAERRARTVTPYERKTEALMSHAAALDYHVCPEGAGQSLLTEWRMIDEYQPRYNVKLKNDRNAYPHIAVSIQDKVPQCFATYNPSRSGRHKVFGPYTDYSTAKNLVKTIDDVYKLRARKFEFDHGGHLDLPSYRRDCIEEGAMLILNGRMDEAAAKLRARGDEEGAVQLESRLAGRHAPTDDKLTALGEVDVVTAAPAEQGTVAVQLMQLRGGAVMGRFVRYLTSGDEGDEPDLAEATRMVLEQHYLRSGATAVPPVVLAVGPVADSDDLVAMLAESRDANDAERDNAPPFRLALMSDETADMDDGFVAAAAMATANLDYVRSDRARAMDRAQASLVDLAAILGTDRLPRRIEAFDISHTDGTDAVGSNVVFIDGREYRAYYRTFALGDGMGGDDYIALAESLARRLRLAQGDNVKARNELPDVFVIDGGKGQLSAALAVVEAAGLRPGEDCHVVSLAKRAEEVFVRDETTGQIRLIAGGDVGDPNQAALLLLRHLRDEAHALANAKHRRGRSQTGVFMPSRRAEGEGSIAAKM